MSAFIVDPETMRKAVTAADAMHNGRKFEMAEVIVPESLRVGERDKALTELGRALYRMNAEAIRQRYGEDDPAPEYVHESYPVMGRADLIACYKAARCLRYQCSEGDVPESRTYRQLEELISALADEIVSELPEYREAAWD